MVKAIIFDMAGVIFSRAPTGVERYIQPIINKPSEEIINELKKSEFRDFLCGKIDEDTYWESIIKRTGWDIGVETLKKLIRKHMKPIEGVLDIIKTLKNKNYTLCLLSGHTKEWTEYLNESYNYEIYFNAIIYSFQVGYNKPDRRIYNYVLNEIKTNPEDCIFIDDNDKLLEPAKKLGMKTIHFDNAKQLKEELAEFDIIV